MFKSRLRVAFLPSASLNELSVAELFVVCSLRLWLLPHCDSHSRYPDWRRGFLRAGIETEGARSFDRLCHILATSTLEPFLVHRLHCPVLAEHEVWFLQVLGLAQCAQLSAAQTCLTRYCAPTGARLALQPAQTVARALDARQLYLGPTVAYPSALACAAPATHTAPIPGSTSVH